MKRGPPWTQINNAVIKCNLVFPLPLHTIGREMQSLRIILTCIIILTRIVAAVLYGIVHDQFTAHICVEYFSMFHPPVFPTESPILLALGWGVIATWWVGEFLGVLLAFAARAGSRRKIDAIELVRPISRLLLAMGVLAAMPALTGYITGSLGCNRPTGIGRRCLACCETCAIHGCLVGSQCFVFDWILRRNCALHRDYP